MDGITLDEVIHDRGRGRALPAAEAASIARQIADALDAAHEKGIIHRDLKPANVKIRADGVVKVLDFGLGRGAPSPDSGQPEGLTMTSDGTLPGMVLGSTAYVSPEQARGSAVDKRADIWAFGCVLYEMLTGVRAFEGETRWVSWSPDSRFVYAAVAETDADIVLLSG